MIHIKRVYENPSETDGVRVLVDRLWPRGVSKERAMVDMWLKEVAPSPGLRMWFSHDPKKFREFTERYKLELAHNSALPTLVHLVRDKPTVTLIYGAKDLAINHAVVLKAYLEALA